MRTRTAERPAPEGPSERLLDALAALEQQRRAREATRPPGLFDAQADDHEGDEQ
jgi:hypothetical protein